MLAAPAAAALLSACGARDDPQRVRMWAMDAEGANVKYLLPAFRQATGISVDAQALPWTAAHEKMLTAYAGDSLPDVMMLSNAWIAEFALIGAIEPLPAAQRGLLADQFAGVRAAAQVGGRDYGVPWVVGAMVQFFRRDLLARAGFDSPPLELDAWKAMLHAVRRRAGSPFAVLMLLDWPEHLFNFAAQMPDPLLRDRDARGNFRSAGFRETLAFYKSLFDEGLAPRVVSTELSDPLTEFARGWFAIYLSGSWTVAEIARRGIELPRARWGTAMLPGRDGPGVGGVAGSSLLVPRGARNAARGWQLIKYLCQPDTQVRFRTLAGSLPSRPSAWASPALARDPAMATFADQIARATPGPKVPEWAQIATETQFVAERMVRGLLTVDQAAMEMDARADRILEKRRWMLDRGTIA